METTMTASQIFRNFVFMSIAFALNHGCVSACLGLATSRLGTGAAVNGLLYLTYTGSALFGASSVVESLGARNALAAGMLLYTFYVAAFGSERVATQWLGAVLGGIGAGFLWTAQGAYFRIAAQQYAATSSQENHMDKEEKDNHVQSATSYLAGVFAFLYLSLELMLLALSSILLRLGQVSWSTVFQVYATLTLVSAVAMLLVPQQHHHEATKRKTEESDQKTLPTFAAFDLLWRDSKIRYMIGLNAVSGFAGAFVNSYVNGQVVRVVFQNGDAFVGILTAWASGVAAVLSLILGHRKFAPHKGIVLQFGAACFLAMAVSFMIQPDISSQWSPLSLVLIYTLHGTGRATFESTLKATVADFFPSEPGAFPNIILQNGLASALGFFLTYSLTCEKESVYCVVYRDGSLHNVLAFELILVFTALMGIFGYRQAEKLHKLKAT